MSDEKSFHDRRTFLKTTAAGVGTVGLAGCTGGGDDPEGDDGDGQDGGNGQDDGTEKLEGQDQPDPGADELVMVTSGAETGTYASSQGIAAAINQNTDEVFLDARPSGGTDDNIGMMNRGEADIGLIQHRSTQLIIDEEEPYHEIGFVPQQLFHHSDLPWLFVTNDPDVSSVADLESHHAVSPTPRGSGSAPVLERALEHAGAEYERVSVEFGEQTGALQEGRIDVAAITISNFSFEAAWIQEMKQTVDTRILGWPEDAIEAMEDDPLIPVAEFELDDEVADGYAHVPDPLYGINMAYNYVTHQEVPYDPVYEMLETMWENREEMAETHLYMEFFLEDEWWTTRLFDAPVHPAAADFYEEVGVWSDDFERGELDV